MVMGKKKTPGTAISASVLPTSSKALQVHEEANQAFLAGTMLTRIEAQQTAMVAEMRQYNENIHQLNLALGEFRARSIEPIRKELEHLRYNLGSRTEDVVGMMQKMVVQLDAQLSRFMSPNQKVHHGLEADLPRPEELTDLPVPDTAALLAALTHMVEQLRTAPENPPVNQK